MKYEIGDIIIVFFPFSDKSDIKKRPALITDVGDNFYEICQITSTNRTRQFKGVWINKDSFIGKQMGIKKNSFINFENRIKITDDFILKKIGFYADFKK